MSKTWTTEIDSDVGKLELTITYDIDSGSWGDYYTDSVPASINIIKYEVAIQKGIPAYLEQQFEDEIADHETTYDPEDYRD